MISQFYNVITKTPYVDGFPFHADAPYPEGEGWVRVLSKKRVKTETLARKASKIDRESRYQ